MVIGPAQFRKLVNDKMTITWDLNCDTLYLVVSGLYQLMQAYGSNVCAN